MSSKNIKEHLVGQPLLKWMMKMTPESVMNAQMNKLYAIDK